LFSAGIAVLNACAAPDAPPVAAVIVMPKLPVAADEVVRVAQASVDGEAGVRYVRPLAGGAHLLHLTAPAAGERVPALLDRLRSTSAFRYVELDSMMKKQ
jgi:hypothetical protein